MFPSPPTHSPGKTHLLYNINLNPRPEIEQLYFKYKDDKNKHHPISKGDKLFAPEGVKIEFDTYFASFYEKYWFEYTNIEKVAIKIKVDGKCYVNIIRNTLNGDSYRAAKLTPDQNGEVYHEFSKDSLLPDVPARMFATIEPLEDITIHEVSWVTPTSPLNKVALDVCFTTFNRLTYLKRIINDILSDNIAIKCISKITIVNQGDDFSLQDLVSQENLTLGSEIIELIKQENLGGCGGFTRGMYNSLNKEEITHILLCDDDIVFDPDSLSRLSAFLTFCKTDIAVGGQMLDVLRPNFLYESGAVLRRKTLTPKPIGHNLFLPHSSSLNTLISQPEIDYNGWWYFAFPKKFIETYALPMPCFIRGDDIEYGVRLRKNGVNTIIIPGMAVWHEPFYTKLGAWHYYYEIKNRLVLQLIHYQKNRMPHLNNIVSVFLRDLFTCRYYTAKLAILALQDFLGGPEKTLTCSSEKLKEIQSLSKKFEYKNTKDDYMQVTECRHIRNKYIRSLFKAKWLFSTLAFLINITPIPLPKKTNCYIEHYHFNINHVGALSEFTVREADGKTFRTFKRSRTLFFSLLAEFFITYIRIAFSSKSIESKYLESFNSYISIEHWKKILPLPKNPDTSPKQQ